MASRAAQHAANKWGSYLPPSAQASRGLTAATHSIGELPPPGPGRQRWPAGQLQQPRWGCQPQRPQTIGLGRAAAPPQVLQRQGSLRASSRPQADSRPWLLPTFHGQPSRMHPAAVQHAEGHATSQVCVQPLPAAAAPFIACGSCSEVCAPGCCCRRGLLNSRCRWARCLGKAGWTMRDGSCHTSRAAVAEQPAPRQPTCSAGLHCTATLGCTATHASWVAHTSRQLQAMQLTGAKSLPRSAGCQSGCGTQLQVDCRHVADRVQVEEACSGDEQAAAPTLRLAPAPDARGILVRHRPCCMGAHSLADRAACAAQGPAARPPHAALGGSQRGSVSSQWSLQDSFLEREAVRKHAADRRSRVYVPAAHAEPMKRPPTACLDFSTPTAKTSTSARVSW